MPTALPVYAGVLSARMCRRGRRGVVRAVRVQTVAGARGSARAVATPAAVGPVGVGRTGWRGVGMRTGGGGAMGEWPKNGPEIVESTNGLPLGFPPDGQPRGHAGGGIQARNSGTHFKGISCQYFGEEYSVPPTELWHNFTSKPVPEFAPPRVKNRRAHRASGRDPLAALPVSDRSQGDSHR